MSNDEKQMSNDKSSRRERHSDFVIASTIDIRRRPSFLSRLFMDGVLPGFRAVFPQFKPFGASSFLLDAVIPRSAVGTLQPDVFACHRGNLQKVDSERVRYQERRREPRRRLGGHVVQSRGAIAPGPTISGLSPRTTDDCPPTETIR